MNVPEISGLTLAFFRRIVQGYFRRSFHAVRISGVDHLRAKSGPLIIFANHGSWWDPMVSILLAKKTLPTLRHYAPMDAEALERYPILKRLGIFPIAMKTTRGAVQFLRVGEAILKAGGVLWVTPQGRFVDARLRPILFKPGLAGLAHRVAEHSGSCTLIPLAIEYPFWDERLPETLLLVGQPIHVEAGGGSADDLQTQLITSLQTAMDDLEQLAYTRDPSKFVTLLGGKAGTGGFYGIGQRIKAFVRRKPYVAEHSTPPKVRSVGK